MLDSWTVNDILPFRTNTAAQNEHERLRELLDYIKHCAKTSRGYNMYSLTLADKRTVEVCRHAFIVIMGTSAYKLSRAIMLHNRVEEPPIHGNVAARASNAEESVIAWLKEFLDEDCDKISDTKFIVPSSLTWKDIHAIYAQEQGQFDVPVIASYSLFCAVRKHHFPTLHRPRTGTLATCDTCDQLAFDRAKAKTDAQCAAARDRKLEHRHVFEQERAFMRQNMVHSQQHPRDRIMLFCDYTVPLSLPHFRNTPAVCFSALFVLLPCADMSRVVFTGARANPISASQPGRQHQRGHRRAHPVGPSQAVWQGPEFHMHLPVLLSPLLQARVTRGRGCSALPGAAGQRHR